jgi:ATP-dependent DNA ligase
MKLDLRPPLPPMEALSVETIPEGAEWQYEPKWDGFRCLVFRDGDSVEMQSKSGQPLARYFPELVEAILQVKRKQFVLDGEIVIPAGDSISFDDLLQRIHPAASRIQKLAKAHPAMLIVFDLLADNAGKSLLNWPLRDRRKRLEAFSRKELAGHPALRLSPATMDVVVAKQWFSEVGPTLDGVIAKRVDLPYQSGDRAGMQKIKKIRSVDCVVGGFRYATGKKEVGSLLLGFYGDDGLLHHVGFTSGIKSTERKTLTANLEKLIKAPGFTGRAPGGPSRWATERSGEWVPLKPKLVVEVSYDHFTGGRFRHGTKLVRWRPDKAAGQCRFEQVERQATHSLRLLEP